MPNQIDLLPRTWDRWPGSLNGTALQIFGPGILGSQAAQDSFADFDNAFALPARATPPTLGNSTSAAVTGAASGSISVPSGVVDGNLLLLFVATDNRFTASTPAGWTLVDAQVSSGTGNSVLYTYRRTAASEPASYTVSISGAGQWAMSMIAVTSHGGLGLVQSSASTFGQTFATPSIYTSAESVILTALALDNSLAELGDGLTQVQYVTAAASGRVGVWLGRQGPVTAGTYGPKTTRSPNFPSWSGVTLEILRPAAAMNARMKLWNGTAFVSKPVKIWTGSAWVEKPVKRWDGTAWVAL